MGQLSWSGLGRAIVVAASLAVAACGGAPPSDNKPTVPAATTVPQATVAALPADAAAVVDLLKSRGMPVGEIAVYTGDDDPNKLLGRPNQYTSKASWLDTRLVREHTDKIDVTDGGTVEVFAQEDQAKSRHEYVEKLGQGASFLTQYGYVVGKVHVRLSKRLTPDQAAQYESLLKNPATQLTPLPAVAQQGTATPFAPPPDAKPTTVVERSKVTGAGAEGLNMRAAPSTSAARVKTLKDGDILETIGPSEMADGRAWRNVKAVADGATGWVAAEFLAPADAAAPPPPPAPTAVSKPAAAPSGSAPKPAVPAPAAKPAPGGAIVCNDGSIWPSMTRQGACSRRGGIAPGY